MVLRAGLTVRKHRQCQCRSLQDHEKPWGWLTLQTYITKMIRNPQLEGSAESSNPLLTGGGDHTEVAADVIKRCRFKRRALKCIIERYIYATKELIEQKGSRATIKQNLSDIVETFKKIEGFHAQLEEHSQDEEGIAR